jgi:hypothetical protein
LEIIISREYFQTKKLFFSTPCYGGQTTGVFAKCVADLSNLCTQLGTPLQIYFLFNESLITRARNYAVDEFMRSDCSHFLFVDADIGFDPIHVIQLMALQTEESPYDIIGAVYPKKCISWEKIVAAVNKGLADPFPAVDDKGQPILNDKGQQMLGGGPEMLNKYVGDYVFNPKQGTAQIPIGEPCEVLEIGTGFMMVKRSAFKTFADAHPEFLYRPDHVRTPMFDGHRQITQYFQAEIDQIDFRKFYETEMMKLVEANGGSDDYTITATELVEIINRANELNAKKSNRYLSEDYWFCQKVNELGLKTWICPWMALNHTGTMTYGGSLADIAQLGVSPTADVGELNKYKGNPSGQNVGEVGGKK